MRKLEKLYLTIYYMHECWNRQTGKLEVLVFFGACGFKSRLVHQLAIVPAPMR